MPSDWIYTDPLFYLTAIPAILLIGISKSGFGSGFGSLAVPLIALSVTVPEAAAVLMPLLFVLDLLALRAYRHEYDKALIRSLLPWSMVGIVVGFLLFKYLNSHIVEGVVGVFALTFVAQRVLFPPSPQGVILPRWIGATLTAMSGFTSFVAHAGSPPLNAYLLPMRLPPITYAASMAVLFFWVNLSKWIPYAALGLLDMRGMVTAVLLMPFTPIGIWIGVRLARKMSPKVFYACIQVGLGLTGCKLVYDGFIRGA
ncbi:MAG: sulfite exporter TauE/SafE family protein [Alphaproteobacteria bacterium]|nr:sulfite exporter TauE/SafE family protein [Alphaproteobacteria bacterium]